MCGGEGELYIGGPGVGRGYMNLPEMTSKRFVVNQLDEEGGAFLYRTHDHVRLDDNDDNVTMEWQIENATWTKSRPCVKEDCRDPVVFPAVLGDSSNENEEVRGMHQSRDDACIWPFGNEMMRICHIFLFKEKC